MDITDFKIYIDAGHGGSDPGAVASDGTKEKDINLSVANELDAILINWGVTTKMTRVTDTYVDVNSIAGISNDFGANIFVSIHCNTGHGSGGTETYTHTSYDNYTNDLATRVNNAVVGAYNSINRGVKRANLAVLRGNNAWCCLNELLFMDVSSDLRKLKDPNYQQSVAQAIANGINSFVFANFHNIPNLAEVSKLKNN